MKKNTLKKLGSKALWLSGGSLRLALGGLGATLAGYLLRDKYRRRKHKKHALPFEKIREALKR